MAIQHNEVPATELREHASEIVNRVAFGSEEIVLTRRGKPITAIVSLEALETLHRLEDTEDAAETERARKDVHKRGAAKALALVQPTDCTRHRSPCKRAAAKRSTKTRRRLGRITVASWDLSHHL